MSRTNNIEVKLRIKPLNEHELSQLVRYDPTSDIPGQGLASSSPRLPYSGGSIYETIDCIDEKSMKFDSLRKGRPPGKRPPKDRLFEFDRIFGPKASQREVYEETTKELLDLVLDGYNATALAYGATGCGKTHTTSGTAEDPGLIPLTMDDLFARVVDEKDKFETIIEITMIEIYNENVYDLLSDNFGVGPRKSLPLLEDGKRRITVAGVQSKQPTTTAEVMDLIMLGNSRRSTNATACNATSSRSHAVLQVNVKRRQQHQHDADVENDTVSTEWTTAVLTIIDLAGSERAAATQNMGVRMKEGANINKSLLALGNVINALATGKAGVHVTYRASKLTRLLQFSLGGNCRTVMIACVSSSSKDIEESWNTLLYADRAKKIKTQVSRNTAGVSYNARQYVETIAKQQRQIDFLQGRVDALEKDSGDLKRKSLQEARSHATNSLNQISIEVSKQLPYIIEGAELRARMDAAEIASQLLNKRIEAIDSGSPLSLTVDPTQEKQLCSTLINKHKEAYQYNRSIQNCINREQTQKSQIEQLLKQTEQRKFSDLLESVDREYIRIKVESERSRMALAVAQAQEKGFRDALASQAEIIGKLVAALADMNGRIRQHEESLTRVISNGGDDRFSSELDTLQLEMRKSVTESDSTSRMILDLPAIRASALTLPPPQAINSPIKLSSSSVDTSVNVDRVGMGKPSAIALASPAIKRLLDPSVFTSPIRSPTTSAPSALRSKPPTLSLTTTASALATAGTSGVPVTAPPQKAFRWTDMAGEGSLEEIKTITPRTSAGSSFANTSISELSQDPDTSDPLTSIPPISGLPTSSTTRTSMLPPPSRLTTASQLMPPPTLPIATPSIFTPTLAPIISGVETGIASGNDWRSFRSAQAKERQANTSVSGDISMMSTIMGPPSGPLRPLSALAPIASQRSAPDQPISISESPSSTSSYSAPTRPTSSAGGSVLRESRQIPGPRPSTSMSNLMKPTASSIARNGGGIGGDGGVGSGLGAGSGLGISRPSSGRASIALSTSERRPSTGPTRSTKLIKARDSLIPYKPIDVGEDSGSSPERVGGSLSQGHNPLGGGAKRGGGMSSVISGSTVGGGVGGGTTAGSIGTSSIRRPRESIPPIIRHTAASARRQSAIPMRQSISNLSRAAGMIGSSGDTSIRAWK